MNTNSTFLSVGIDVGSTFSFMAIVDPLGNVISKPFKILHNSSVSLAQAVSLIHNAEETYSLKSHIFLESTGIYHFPLFCHLKEVGFHVSVINPLLTHSIKNSSIRKVKNDRIDSIRIATLGLTPNLQTSLIPEQLVLELRTLTRKYYELTDERASHVTRLKQDLHVVFPQYLGLFSDITGATSSMLLKQYLTPENILNAPRSSLIQKIAASSRRGIAKATECYERIVCAAQSALSFGCKIESVYFNISMTLNLIEYLDQAISSILKRIEFLTSEHESELFVKQIYLLKTIPGIGFLSAVTIMCELGDFSSFRSPKQLFAYFGMDPTVNESGKFKATEVHMSKRGSKLARRSIFAVALACIRTKKDGSAVHPYLYAYYQKKQASKPKMVAIGAVMHKVCNIIFAVLRNNTSFELRSPEEHCYRYQRAISSDE